MSDRSAPSLVRFPLMSSTIPTAPWHPEPPDPVWAKAAVRRLTDREREILELVAGWWTDQEIADALCISYRTVTTHVGHIYDKLGVASRRAAAMMLLLAIDEQRGRDRRSP
jgi:LuxR family transcriptional regulator, maltose regulon positive regulatory protein